MRSYLALVPAVTLFLLSLGSLSLAQGTTPVVSQPSSLVARLRANLPNRGVPGSRFGGQPVEPVLAAVNV